MASAFDERNRLESAGGGKWTFSYDLNGNMIGKTNTETGEQVDYYYDADNMLTRVESRTANALKRITHNLLCGARKIGVNQESFWKRPDSRLKKWQSSSE